MDLNQISRKQKKNLKRKINKKNNNNNKKKTKNILKMRNRSNVQM